MSRRRTLRCWLAAAVLASAVAVPAAADPGEQLRRSRDQLGGARDQLSAAEQRLEQARTALVELEASLDAHTAELAALEGRLAGARAAEAHAEAATDRINAELRTVDLGLASLVDSGDRNQDRLDARAADAYKRGGGARSGDLLSSLLAAGDLHDLSLGWRVVTDALEEDRRLVESADDLTLAAARARRQVAALRTARLREETAVRRAREQVEQLVARQTAVLGRVAAQRDERARILAATEADRDQAAALVRRLETVAARLATQLAAAVDLRWQDIEVDGPMPEWAARIPAHGRRWAPAVHDAAVTVGIDPRLLAALVWSESNFHAGAVSSAGAVGLTQLMPGTAAGLGVDPWHPVQNLAGGARYLAAQHARFGSVELALAAYNAGPGAVERYGGIPPYAETQYYVLAVLERYARIAAG